VPPWSPLIGHLVLTSTLAAGPRDDLDARRGSSRVVVGMPAQQWEPARAPPRERLHCCGSLLAHAAEEVRTRRHGYRSPPTSRWLVGRCSRTPPREPGPTAMAAVRRYTGNKGIDAAASPARPRWKLVVRCPPRAPRRLAGCAGRAGRTRGAGHIGRTHEGGCGADCARTRSRSRPRKPRAVERMSAAVRGSPETIRRFSNKSVQRRRWRFLSFFFYFCFFSSFFLLYFCFFLLYFSFPFLFNFPFSLFLFLFYFLFLCLFLYFILFYYFQLFHFLFLFFFIFFYL
jgi:hypothetical protein